MTVYRSRSRPIVVQINVLHGSSSSASTSEPAEFGYASRLIWDILLTRKTKGHGGDKGKLAGEEQDTDDFVSVAIQWPREGRLGDKGKRKNLVVRIRCQQSIEDGGPPGIHVPAHLLPPFFSPTPLSALVQLHQPIDLSLVVLQPITSTSMSDSAHLELEDFNLSSCYESQHPHNIANGHVNGHVNGHGHTPNRPAPIFRQGEIITLPRRTGSTQPLRILMLDPVQQGVLTPKTRVVISTKPYVFSGDAWNDKDGMLSESSRSSTHRSMADFDPDTFLSSSLDIHLNQHFSLPNGIPTMEETDMAQSISSSTSGSITPRPSDALPLTPPSPPAQVEEVLGNGGEMDMGGTRFTAVIAQGPSSTAFNSKCSQHDDDDVCWLGVGGLGKAGIFEGDWVLLRAPNSETSNGGRLVKAMAWEKLDQDEPGLPSRPILLSPALYRTLIPVNYHSTTDILVLPTAFGSRVPTLPVARTITLARVATAEGVDKRYERAWVRGLKGYFTREKEGGVPFDKRRLVKRGDIIPIPVGIDKLMLDDDTEAEQQQSSSDSDEETSGIPSLSFKRRQPKPIAVAYFIVTGLSYEPLVPLEEDFRSSASSKARAGELGCWVDVGGEGSTKMVLTGVERARIGRRADDQAWYSIDRTPPSFNQNASIRLRDLLNSCLTNVSFASILQLSILVKGARGAGKSSLIRSTADELGYNVVTVDCWDIIGDTPAHTEGAILAAIDKTSSCSPSILLLHNIEALAKRSEAGGTGRSPGIVKVLDDALISLREASGKKQWPCIMVGTTSNVDDLPGEVLGSFKQKIELSAPNEAERLAITREALRDDNIAPDVAPSAISMQSAALQAADIVALIRRARDLARQRATSTTGRSVAELDAAGVSLTAADVDKALGDARASYSESIGAPKIPSVRWEDVGGLASVKKEILETVQLPLERPELFADGLKKRSGILLYGPPGTGKTLLAKAVATSCSLNFFSVKGPELLNMYIGESEANVRRVFQRARDASPCIIFMDELDSVAPKRGNQGDSGGVMDRIVSQLLAELDGMSSNGASGDVFVMGATNRPDLLDPALLRPGRFDRMLYLSVATTHDAQLSMLQALTRKFDLEPTLDLADIAEMCPYNYTGADFYALCSDAMLRAMTRKAEHVDKKIEELNGTPPPHSFPHPLTPQYYLGSMATRADVEVEVGMADFEEGLKRLVPSVSAQQMVHYERVQKEFKGYAIGSDGRVIDA